MDNAISQAARVHVVIRGRAWHQSLDTARRPKTAIGDNFMNPHDGTNKGTLDEMDEYAKKRLLDSISIKQSIIPKMIDTILSDSEAYTNVDLAHMNLLTEMAGLLTDINATLSQILAIQIKLARSQLASNELWEWE
jgi:hypothetical protein